MITRERHSKRDSLSSARTSIRLKGTKDRIKSETAIEAQHAVHLSLLFFRATPQAKLPYLVEFVYKKDPNYIYPIEDIQVRLQVKREICEEMYQYDRHEFWVDNREAILSESILTRSGQEYKLGTLNDKLKELRVNGVQSPFFRQLVKVRKDYLLFDRWN